MEKITTRAEMLEKLEWLKNAETGARNNYESHITRFINSEIKDKMKLLQKQEEEHLKLINELIDMLKK